MVLNTFKGRMFPIQSSEVTRRPGMLASIHLDLTTTQIKNIRPNHIFSNYIIFVSRKSNY